MARTLKTIRQFADETPFPENQLRAWIARASENGFQKFGLPVRVGRRVYIDPEAFYRWVDAQQNAKPEAA